MRVSEAVALDRSDVDLEEGIVTIRRTKFGKTRHVPVHPSTRDALRAYAARRDEIMPLAADRGFFPSEAGTRVTDWSARYNFALVSRAAAVRQPGRRKYGHGHGPRLHDLRHCFASQTLIDWYRARLDVEREIPRLATYLGHVSVKDTYWYLEAVPELLALATERLTRMRQEKIS
jgi:integrase